MVKLFYSPKWFYSSDIIIDIFSLSVLLLISFFAFRYYKTNKNKNNLRISISFAVLAVAFIIKVLINYNLYYALNRVSKYESATMISEIPKYVPQLVFFILIYYLIAIAGAYLIYSLYHKKTPQSRILDICLLLIVITLSYYNYEVFHFTLFVIFSIITSKFIGISKKKNKTSTKLLGYSFGIISLSQALFVFVESTNKLYVVGSIIELLGYFLLLVTFIMVRNYGKKI